MLALVSVSLGAVGQLLLRAGSKSLAGSSFADTLLGALSHPSVIAGLALYGLSAVIWLMVLSRLELTVAYPLGASGYVLVVALAWFAGEQIPPLRWLGVLLIVVGVLLVGWLGVPKNRGSAA